MAYKTTSGRVPSALDSSLPLRIRPASPLTVSVPSLTLCVLAAEVLASLQQAAATLTGDTTTVLLLALPAIEANPSGAALLPVHARLATLPALLAVLPRVPGWQRAGAPLCRIMAEGAAAGGVLSGLWGAALAAAAHALPAADVRETWSTVL